MYQGEQLQWALTEKRPESLRHYRALLNAAEETVSCRPRETEVEVEQARHRNAELEAMLLITQTWWTLNQLWASFVGLIIFKLRD